MNEVNKMNKVNQTDTIDQIELHDIDTLYDCMKYAKLYPKEFIFWDSTMSGTYTYVYVYYDNIIKEYICYIGGTKNELFIMNFDNYSLLSKNIGHAINRNFDFPMTGRIETLYDCIRYARMHPNHFVFWNTEVDCEHHIYYDDTLGCFVFYTSDIKDTENTEDKEVLMMITLDTNWNLLSKNIGYKFLDKNN